ncbi:hypothetical protein ACTFIR_009714 [Dictyostelium discoideum]
MEEETTPISSQDNLRSDLSDEQITEIATSKYGHFKDFNPPTKYIPLLVQKVFRLLNFLKDIGISLDSWDSSTRFPITASKYFLDCKVIDLHDEDDIHKYIHNNKIKLVRKEKGGLDVMGLEGVFETSFKEVSSVHLISDEDVLKTFNFFHLLKHQKQINKKFRDEYGLYFMGYSTHFKRLVKSCGCQNEDSGRPSKKQKTSTTTITQPPQTTTITQPPQTTTITQPPTDTSNQLILNSLLEKFITEIGSIKESNTLLNKTITDLKFEFETFKTNKIQPPTPPPSLNPNFFEDTSDFESSSSSSLTPSSFNKPVPVFTSSTKSKTKAKDKSISISKSKSTPEKVVVLREETEKMKNMVYKNIVGDSSCSPPVKQISISNVSLVDMIPNPVYVKSLEERKKNKKTKVAQTDKTMYDVIIYSEDENKKLGRSWIGSSVFSKIKKYSTPISVLKKEITSGTHKKVEWDETDKSQTNVIMFSDDVYKKMKQYYYLFLIDNSKKDEDKDEENEDEDEDEE